MADRRETNRFQYEDKNLHLQINAPRELAATIGEQMFSMSMIKFLSTRRQMKKEMENKSEYYKINKDKKISATNNEWNA